jgi:NAD(P)-dependent dehydrogenase (short-subunit alcohol dehydrogenase family)
VKHLHGQGYRVAVTGRRVAAGEVIAKDLDPSLETAVFVQCDVESYASQANLFRQVWKKWGRLDVLVQNAGIVDQASVYNFQRRGAAIDDIPDEPDLKCTEVDWKGVVYGTTLATHFMRHNAVPGGKIIITGSMIGVHPCPTFPEYCSVKAAVLHWVRTMAPLLLTKENITINVVLPGAVDTPVMPGFNEAFLPEQ